jgi:hypothetical protein
MKRHHTGEFKQVEDRAVDAFLAELVQVCKKHGFSLGHEDTQGAFIVEKYAEDNIRWLKSALIGKSIDAT